MTWKLIPEDSKQALRLKRFLMAALAYALWLGLAIYCYFLGLLAVSGAALALVVVLVIATNLAWFMLFRSGFNLRFSDPSLTLPQMVVGAFWAMLMVWATPQVRGSMLLLYTVLYLFGMFRLRRKQYLAFTLLTLVGYGLILIWDMHYRATPGMLRIELLQSGVLLVTLVWLAFFGSYIGRLREKLARRNQELGEALARNRELAIHDDLTGTYNRRYIVQVLEEESVRVRRTGRPFSICLLDLDHFKRINDQHGHLVGDDILRQFAEQVVSEIRAMDRMGRDGADQEVFARYGGEEFLLVLPETMAVGARTCAERIRNSIAAAQFTTETGSLSVSVSIGVTEHHSGEHIRDMLKRVDRALYRAKHAGRNRVESLAEE